MKIKMMILAAMFAAVAFTGCKWLGIGGGGEDSNATAPIENAS